MVQTVLDAGWQNQGYACYNVTRTYTEKSDLQIGEQEKETEGNKEKKTGKKKKRKQVRKKEKRKEKEKKEKKKEKIKEGGGEKIELKT